MSLRERPCRRSISHGVHLFLAALVANVCLSAPAHGAPLPRVLIIGDSISIGYTSQVRELLGGIADVQHNPGNAMHTWNGLEKLDAWLGDGQWDVIHFNWGLHDLSYRTNGKPDLTGKRTSTAQEYERNLDRLVTRLQATGAKLIWASSTPIPDGTNVRFQGQELEFNTIARKVMDSHHVAIDDLHAYISPRLAEYQQAHNVHFTREGYRYLAQQVARSIREALPDRAPSTATATSAADAGRRPNVVFILTDNQSAWTLGCYGNKDIHTPNIDRLAAEGVRFDRAFSCNAVCSPTRATYLTGLIPSQHGVHSYLGAGVTGPDAYYRLKEFRTLPRILHDAGYVCGLAGKWHLGDYLHPQDGFTYWVTKPGGHTNTFYDAEVIEDGAVRKERTYLTEFWTKHAVRFIEQNKDRPFFLYLPYNGPYGLGQWITQPGRGPHVAEYADKELPCFPREPVHEWLRANRKLIGNLTAMRRYSEEISGVDDGVGSVMATLQRLHLDENTLVVFTADQGLAAGHHGFWGMADHGRPLNTFDAGLQIPLIWRLPGASALPHGGTCDLLVSNYDFMPTLLSYLGLADRMAKSPESPGRDYSAALRGKTPAWDNAVFYEYENSRMIRTDRWKLTRRFPDGPDELYDLRADPGEKNNRIGKADQADIQGQMQQRLDAFFNRYADPKYDLAHNGTSKAPRVTIERRGTTPPERRRASSAPARANRQQ